MTPLQIIFIVAAVLVVLLVVFIILYRPLKSHYTKKNFKDMYGKKIYKLAQYHDFYLINEFLFAYEDNRATTIDHILFGDKYIYLIKDCYYDGSLTGKLDDDNSLIKTTPKGKVSYVENPNNELKKNLDRLTRVLNMKSELFICITLVNPECIVEVSQNSKQFYLVQCNKADRLVTAIETRAVSPIDEEQLHKFVQDLARYNKKGKRIARAKNNS